MTKQNQLTKEQVELLYSARQMDDPRLVESDDLSQIREALSAPLKDLGMRDGAIESMSVAALARQFAPSDDEDESDRLTLDSLAQDPECGGTDGAEANAAIAGEAPDEDDEPELADSVEALASTVTVAQANDVDQRLAKISAMEGRTPKYAETLRKELAEDLDAEKDVVSSLGRSEWRRETNLD